MDDINIYHKIGTTIKLRIKFHYISPFTEPYRIFFVYFPQFTNYRSLDMIEKNVTVIPTVHELVQYPHPVFTLFNVLSKTILSIIKESVDYILRFDLCIYKRHLNSTAKRKNNKYTSNTNPNTAVYCVVDSVNTDVKRVLDIMKIFND